MAPSAARSSSAATSADSTNSRRRSTAFASFRAESALSAWYHRRPATAAVPSTMAAKVDHRRPLTE